LSGETLTTHTALQVNDLGLQVSYADGMAAMRGAVKRLEHTPDDDAGTLFLLEHQDTITLTRSGGETHLKKDRTAIEDDGICVIETDRGGDVTFHGTGQLVGYPVVRLGPGNGLRVNLLGYVHALEEALVGAVVALGVKGAHRKEGMTGVWIASDVNSDPSTWEADDAAAKLVAIGVGVGRGVTRHGFALNVTTDLDRFTDRITPCGLTGRPVTSLDRLLDVTPTFAHVKDVCAQHIADRLGLQLRAASPAAASAGPSSPTPFLASSDEAQAHGVLHG